MKTGTALTRGAFIKLSAGAGVAAGAGLRPDSRAAAAAPGPAWQIGCYTRPWDQHDYRVALDGIAEAGYKYAGLMTAKGKSWVIITWETPLEEAARIGREVQQRGLMALSLYGGTSRDIKNAAPNSAGQCASAEVNRSTFDAGAANVNAEFKGCSCHNSFDTAITKSLFDFTALRWEVARAIASYLGTRDS